jgi:hypothetical protein
MENMNMESVMELIESSGGRYVVLDFANKRLGVASEMPTKGELGESDIVVDMQSTDGPQRLYTSLELLSLAGNTFESFPNSDSR